MSGTAYVDSDLRSGYREACRREVEELLIGSLVIEPQRIDEVSHVVTSSDFSDASLGMLFAMLVSMREAKRRVNPKDVLLEAKKNTLWEDLGGSAGIGKILSKVPNAANYEHYAREVARYSACSKAGLAADVFVEALARPKCDPRKAIESLIASIQDLGVTADAKQLPIHDVLSKIYADGFKPNEEFNKDRIGTGYPRLDALIGGLYPQSLVLLGGYFGSGKSTMASDIAARAAYHTRSILLFSIEMTAEEFGQRILTIEAGISMHAWQRQRTEDEQRKIKVVTDLSRQWKFSIDETSRQSLSSIRAAARLKKASRDGLDLLVVDNLTLINHPGEPKERYKAITIELKKLSRELNCCVLLVAQLNADSVNSEPNSKSWADCKSIEGDADVAMMLHKHARAETWKQGDLDDYSLIVTKNRSRGDKGKIPLTWDGEFQRFSDGSWTD